MFVQLKLTLSVGIFAQNNGFQAERKSTLDLSCKFKVYFGSRREKKGVYTRLVRYTDICKTKAWYANVRICYIDVLSKIHLKIKLECSCCIVQFITMESSINTQCKLEERV